VARSVGVSASTVAAAFADAKWHGLTASAIEELSDAELEAYLYPPSRRPRARAVVPRTRGCSAVSVSNVERAGVVPARAGVLRPR